ncbi:MAG: condensation domain-containing protein [Alcanivoracaceae bacterium]|nr:condensation domain-containing protein [Alcanivoracaceae bacterium]
MTQTRADVPERFRLSLTDELFMHIDKPASPFSVQLELRVNQRLDAQKLAGALLTASTLHPMARVALAPYKPSDKFYVWEQAELLDYIPLQERECSSEEDLDLARSELHSASVSLEQAPPFRCLLVHTDGGDYVMINMSHAVSDGVGEYRFLTSVMRAYAGVPDPQPALDFISARDLSGLFGSRKLRERLNRITRLLEILGTAITPPARIAKDGDSQQGGVAFVPVRFSEQETARLHTLRSGQSTLNDVLIALLHQAIARWNRAHGQKDGRISVMMPMNARPNEWRHELVSNLSLWVNVISRPEHQGNFSSLLEVVSKQTRNLKDRGTAGLLVDLLHEIRGLPVWIKQALPSLLPLSGHRIVDTTVLNNLGRLPPILPAENSLKITEAWFSSPCRLPMGLSVGAATLDDQLRLSFRYSLRQFDREGAWAFVENFLDGLAAELAIQ